jgi:hypothetical protein
MKKKLFILALPLLVLIITFSYIIIKNHQNQTNKQSKNQVSTNSEQITSVELKTDDENDGTYTSYIHNFKFKYPSSIFVNQSKVFFHNEEKTEDVCWFNENTKNVEEMGAMGLNPDTGIFMCVLATTGDQAQQRFYQLYNADPKNSPRMGVREIKQITNDNYKQYILFAKTPEGRETEHSVSYFSGWLTNDGRLVELFIAAGEDKDNLLNKYKKNFDQIVDSFECSI